MTGDGVHSYQWDGEGRLASMDNGSTWGFTYNAVGDRVQWAYTGGADQHLYDPAGNWMGIGGVDSVIQLNGHLWEWYWNGQTDFSHFNNLHSASMITGHSGAVGDDVLFYPWGQYWTYGENFADLPYYDTKTQNIFATYRAYSPRQGRWFSPDPVAGDITNPQSLNRYAYVMNNPTSFNDPLGLQGCENGIDEEGNDCIPEEESQSNHEPNESSMFKFTFSITLVELPAPQPAPNVDWTFGASPDDLRYLGSSEGRGGSAPNKVNCPDVPAHPSNANVNSNIRQAQVVRVLSWLNPPTYGATTYGWFVARVAPHMSWDYKRQGVQYAPFGNFNYGATGAALGIPLQQLQMAGGLVAQTFGTHQASWGNWYEPPAYGHDPADVQSIAKGYAYYQQGCHK